MEYCSIDVQRETGVALVTHVKRLQPIENRPPMIGTTTTIATSSASSLFQSPMPPPQMDLPFSIAPGLVSRPHSVTSTAPTKLQAPGS